METLENSWKRGEKRRKAMKMHENSTNIRHFVHRNGRNKVRDIGVVVQFPSLAHLQLHSRRHNKAKRIKKTKHKYIKLAYQKTRNPKP